MKTPMSSHMVAFLLFGMIAPLSAQNLDSADLDSENSETPFKASGSTLFGTYEIPEIARVQGEVTDEQSAAPQYSALSTSENHSRDVGSIVNLDVLRKPSPFRRMLVSAQGSIYEVDANSLQTGLAEISAFYREGGKTETSSDCDTISLSVGQRVKLDPSKLLEIVQLEVGANTNCACEIVKTAIKASEADVVQVVAIAEAAIHASPESMRMISQCAIAACPEVAEAMQALLAKLDPNAGEASYSSKSAKSAKVAPLQAPPLPNPLDLPPTGPPIGPLIIIPPPVTNVNP